MSLNGINIIENVIKWNFNYEVDDINHSNTKFVIYEIKNIISKMVYIGQTKRKLKQRWADYKNDLLRPIQIKKRSGSNIKLKRSVQKHFKKEGNIDFLQFSIIEIVDISLLVTEEEKHILLDEREQFYIKEYRKLYGKNKVCNVLDGGRTYIFTEENRKTMGESQKKFFETEDGKLKKLKLKQRFSGSGNPMYGKTHTEESIRKNTESNTGKQSGENNPMYGKRHNEEAKNKISLANKGRPSCLKNSKRPDISGIKNPSAKIYDLSLNSLMSPNGDEFFKIECLEEFCKKHSLLSNKMCQVISGKRKIHKGWHLKQTFFNKVY